MPDIPLSAEVDYMNPTFTLEVEGQGVDVGVTQFIESVEYESVDGMADVLRIKAVNPDFVLSNAKVFQPGNEVAVWMGYGNQQEFVGRVIIKRQIPTFPQDGMPTIQCTGYTKDTFLMDNEPPVAKDEYGQKKKQRKGKKKKRTDDGRVFKDSTIAGAVERRAKDGLYQFTNLDIDEYGDEKGNHVKQKTGMSDYDLIIGLANYTGFVFWVDGGDSKGVWNLYFKDPKKLPELQDKKYTFRYNMSDDSTLLNFQPEFLIQDSITDMTVETKNPKNGKIWSIDIGEQNNKSPDLSAAGDLTGLVGDDMRLGGKFADGGGGSLTTGSDVKLFFEQFSFSIKTDKKFNSIAELEAWAKQWYRRHRENFVLSSGRIIGVGSIRARQVHVLEGLGNLYSGEYYFNKVKHICSNSLGYVIDFNARKMVPSDI